jgi:hypothetical protein
MTIANATWIRVWSAGFIPTSIPGWLSVRTPAGNRTKILPSLRTTQPGQEKVDPIRKKMITRSPVQRKPMEWGEA